MSSEKMSAGTVVPDQIKRFVEEIIAENEVDPTVKIKYAPGSEIGDGYTSKTFTVDVDDDEKPLHLFLKAPLGLSWFENLPIGKLFENEIHFYKSIVPTYREFLKEHNIKNGLRNIPKCYGISDQMIALDNLKVKGFTIFNNKKNAINENHLVLALRTFAKFHAVSFAFKNQKKESYDVLVAGIQSCLTEFSTKAGFDKLVAISIGDFLKSLDPVEDKDLLDASDGLVDKLINSFLNVEKQADEYSIIVQGDCWSNNIMYLYQTGDLNNPNDIMMVDWQLIRHASPALDFGYFLYPISTESILENIEYYLKVYYEELSIEITRLGSDPEVLYPFAVFKNEWKRFARYGFCLSFFLTKGILTEKEEMPNMEEYPEMFDKILVDGEKMNEVVPAIKNEQLYNSRLKMLFRHFIKYDLLS